MWYKAIINHRRNNPLGLVTTSDGGPNSAEFRGSLDSGWSLETGTVNPSFNTDILNTNSGFYIENGKLRVKFEASDNIDPGTTDDIAGLGAPRVEREIDDTDFEVFTKYDYDNMLDDPDYFGSGFILRTATSSARIEVFMFSRNPNAFVKYGSTVPAVTDPRPDGTPNASIRGWPTHQRLKRVGDVFTYYASFDGTVWSEIVSFTWAVNLTHLGVHFFQLTPATVSTAMSLDWIHFEQQSLPVLALETAIVRTTVLTENFADLSNWINDSELGGSATVSNNKLLLSCDATSGSTGRIASSADYGPNVGMVFKAQNVVEDNEVFLGAVLGGHPHLGSDWADPYAPPISDFIFEGNNLSGLYRLLRLRGANAGVPDGGNFTYYLEGTDPDADFTTASWVRMELIPPFRRFRFWADGDIEPTAWNKTIIDGVFIDAPGKVGFALAHNFNVSPSGSMEISDVEIYEIS